MEFTPITTQEEFDRAIVDRLKRERDTLAKKYADYEEIKERTTSYEKQLGELKSQLDETSKKSSTYDQTIAELTGKVSNYELASLKARIAHEKGIPYELAGRLSGDNEKALREDAEILSKLVTAKPMAPPLKSTEPDGDGKDAAYKQILNNIKGE